MTPMNPGAKLRKRRMAVWTVVLILAASLAAPFSGLLLMSPSPALAEEQAEGANPRSGYWREARQGTAGYSTAAGWDNPEAGVLIQNGGQNWRQIRNGWIANYAPWMLAAVLAALILYHLLHGQNKLSERPSGRRILRWRPHERALHATMALLFVALAVTGLSLLFGRALLIPILGKDAFAAYAGAAKNLHNYLGPAFFLCMTLVLLLWLPRNIPNRTDWEWIRRWGGLFGKGAHPDAGFMNGGEKVWYWIVFLAGGAVCVSGMVMDFPNYGQSRETMQWANIIHGGLSIAWLSAALGHIYIGTLGTEGALEGMRTGYVSEEWARQHHNLWLKDAQKSGAAAPQGEDPAPASAPASPGENPA